MGGIMHIAISGSGFSTNSDFVKNLLKGDGPEPFNKFAGKKGELFSIVTLDKFIKEEAIHDDYTLTQNDGRSIRTFSSGEQKKALLNHLFSRKPDFLILENVFDMLDKDSQEDLKFRLQNISDNITIIQIFRRKENILPFIKQVLSFKNNALIFSGSVYEYKLRYSDNQSVSIEDIPRTLVEFEYMEDPLIKFKNVSVVYGEKKILNNIDWEIRNGDFWQLTGPNGSGKTSLLTMITGNNPKAYGQDLTLFGRKKGSGESIWDIKRNIGYVTPSMTVLFPGRHSVENMVISGLYDSIGQYKMPTSLEKKIAGQWIEIIGLKGYKDTWFADLSEEQKCLVLIARSMIKHPPLLILDEPGHGLDDYNVSVLTSLVNKFAEKSRTTIIYVSHTEEKGLKPEKIFELIPGENGSVGQNNR